MKSTRNFLMAALAATVALSMGSLAQADSLDDPGLNEVTIGYDQALGRIQVKADQVALIQLLSAGNQIIPGAGGLIGNFGGTATLDDLSPSEFSWFALTNIIGFTVGEERGNIIQPGTPIGDLQAFYQLANFGSQKIPVNIVPVPEPASMILLGLGGLGLGLVAYRRRK